MISSALLIASVTMISRAGGYEQDRLFSRLGHKRTLSYSPFLRHSVLHGIITVTQGTASDDNLRAMSQEKRLGWAALAMGLLGVAVMYLWPDKKWIGWTFLVAAALVFLAWIYLEIRPTHKAPDELPTLYLFYDPDARGRGILGCSDHTGLFLRTENGRVASKIRINSPDTISYSHKILRIRWTLPGKNVDSNPLPVKLLCVTVNHGTESTFNYIGGDQLPKFFDHKREEDPAELIVTLTYTNVSGRSCPERKFRIWRDTDPVRTLLSQGRIFCEPIKS
jgi:hypothetical protein